MFRFARRLGFSGGRRLVVAETTKRTDNDLRFTAVLFTSMVGAYLIVRNEVNKGESLYFFAVYPSSIEEEKRDKTRKDV